jgi:hypothetical protein
MALAFLDGHELVVVGNHFVLYHHVNIRLVMSIAFQFIDV